MYLYDKNKCIYLIKLKKMAEYNPIGSEKLNGDDKLKRILELTYYNTNKKTSSVKPELVESSSKGGVYGIVKENGSYYIKQGINEQSLDYIGGMFMKNKNKFNSYSEAYKKLEFLKNQENLQEATKYVLKQSKPQQESPMGGQSMDVPPAPPTDTPPAPPTDAPPSDAPPSDEPSSDTGMDTPPENGDTPTGDEDSQESKRSDYMAEIQKFAGKLGQELRDQHQKMESDDIKYVLNMVISAVDLDKLHDKDREKIAKGFEPEEDENSSEPSPEPNPESDSELGEGIDMLDEFINNEFDMNEYSDDNYYDNSSSSYELYPHNPEMRRGGNHQMDTDEIDLSRYADIGEQGEDDYLDSAYEDRTYLDDNDEFNDYDYQDDDDDDSWGKPKRHHSYSDEDLDEIKLLDEPHKKHHNDFGDEDWDNEDFPNPDEDEWGDISHENWKDDDSSKYKNWKNNDEEDDIQEIDLDEIKNEINKHITSTLGKYFKS